MYYLIILHINRVLDALATTTYKENNMIPQLFLAIVNDYA